MTVLHRVRRAVQRVGLDLSRYPHGTPEWRRVSLLRHHGITVVFDVGANDGRFIKELRRLGYTGRAVSFEPVREPFRALRMAAASDPLWITLPYAVGDRSGTVTINVAANDGASSSVLPMLDAHRDAAPHATYTATEEVGMHALDGIWRELASEEDAVYLKVDVQGYESAVLRGAREFLSRCRGVQLEASLVDLYDGGFRLEDALSFARERGFHVAGMEPGFSDPGSGQLLQVDVLLYR